MDDISEQDKLMAALAYPIVGIVALIILLVEDMKSRPFQKYHAVQALIVNVILVILSIMLGRTIILLCVPFLLWLMTLYWTYQAYQGQWVEIPVVTSFIKGQGWV